MDELGRMETPVHRLDARAKILATSAFLVVVVSFPRREVTALVPLALYPTALVAAGGLPAGFLARRVLLAAPFAVLLGLFNPLLDRETAATLWGHPVSGGWLSFASLLARFALTASAALVLVACTGMPRLCAGLVRLGMPRILAVQLLVMHRYLFVIAAEGSRMRRSLALRSAGGGAPPLRVYASLLGHLLLRALDRAQRIHRAMVARGFDGEIRVESTGSWRASESVFLAGWVAFFLAARSWDLPEALGRWLAGGWR